MKIGMRRQSKPFDSSKIRALKALHKTFAAQPKRSDRVQKRNSSKCTGSLVSNGIMAS